VNARPLDTGSPPFVYLASERALLGALMLDHRLLDQVADALQPEDFYRPDHGRLYALIRARVGSGKPVDRLALGESVLALPGGDEQFGGFAYVLALPEDVPAACNVAYYAHEVMQAAGRRRLRSLLREADDAVADPRITPDQLSAMLAATAATFDRHDDGDAGWVFYDDAVSEAAQNAHEAGKGDTVALGPENPLGAWGERIPHFTPGEIHVIAARPGMGKSALARLLAERTAAAGVGVGVLSLEMDPSQVAGLSLASWADIDSRDLRMGRLDQDQWSQVETARRMLGRLPLAVNKGSSLTVEDVVARSRRLHRTMAARGHRLGMIVVDYLQLLKGDARDSSALVQLRGHQTMTLKTMVARALGVPVVLLSQLNRDLEKRADKRPLMSDLRESGSIEQDAATITMVFREGEYNKDSPQDVAELLVRKNRYGAPGDVKVKWNGSRTRFEDAGWNSQGVAV
jgi:replicative DNA helicase